MDLNNVYIFSEVVRCGIIGKIAYETFHKYHNYKLHLYGRKEDFTFITPHPNNIYHILEDDSPIVKAFDHGHRGTAMVWTDVILNTKEQYIIHFDSDVVFRGNAVDDIIDKLKEYDIVGPLRNYENNPNGRDDVRHLPDTTQTFCFGFNKDKIYIKEPELLRSLVENALTIGYKEIIEEYYPNYTYFPSIDFFDPIAFIIMREGGTVYILDKDVFGGTNDMGKRINKYGVLNEHLDFGDKIVHFASVGSGLNFILMNKNNTATDVPEWYQNYGVAKLDLYMRLFYKKCVLDHNNSTFFKYYEGLSNALQLNNNNYINNLSEYDTYLIERLNLKNI